MLAFKRMSIQHSISSPSPTTTSSSSFPASFQPSTSSQGSTRPILRVQSDYCPVRPRMNFFDVVSAAARHARFESPILTISERTVSPGPGPSGSPRPSGSPGPSGSPRPKGFIRKGLREKLAQKAEQARTQAHTLEAECRLTNVIRSTSSVSPKVSPTVSPLPKMRLFRISSAPSPGTEEGEEDLVARHTQSLRINNPNKLAKGVTFADSDSDTELGK